MAQLAYTTREINRNFLIKVAGVNGTGEKLNTLVGVSGLVKLIGVELTNTSSAGVSRTPLTAVYASCAGA